MGDLRTGDSQQQVSTAAIQNYQGEVVLMRGIQDSGPELTESHHPRPSLELIHKMVESRIRSLGLRRGELLKSWQL